MTTTRRSDQARRRMTAPRFINPLVRAVLGSPLHRLLSHKLMLITVRGRRTGQLHTTPVGYTQVGDTLYVLVGDYQTKTWWRSLQGGAPVQLRLRGRTMQATGELLRWESDATALVGALDRYLAAFPAARRSLHLTGRPDVPDPEALRRAAQEVVMVRLRLAGVNPAATMAAVRSGPWDRPAEQGPRSSAWARDGEPLSIVSEAPAGSRCKRAEAVSGLRPGTSDWLWGSRACVEGHVRVGVTALPAL